MLTVRKCDEEMSISEWRLKAHSRMNVIQSTSGHCPDDLLALSVGVQHIVFRLHDSGIGNLNGAHTSLIRWKVSEGRHSRTADKKENSSKEADLTCQTFFDARRIRM